ncbi:MAG: alpha/beta fold hydrolase [Anaerolineae bacterium]|nr:alpha/beta fold hydrolase [Anaerolineae bacterium]
MLRKLLFTVIFLLLIATSLTAQDAADSFPEPTRIEVTASDGLTLVGDFYVVPDAATDLPVALLLHGITQNRQSWLELIPALLEHGYQVLSVDQRAHGETGGDRDLIAASGDVQIWLDWLREQPLVDDANISLIGSSWGTVTATAGCAVDAACATIISISPGDFPTLTEEMFELLEDRSILFIVGRQDNVVYDTEKLYFRTSGEAAMVVYNTALHGDAFFAPRSSYKTRTTDLILDWLDDHRVREAEA